MTYALRFFDDYGSGWLWAGNDEARARFDVGPMDSFARAQLSAETLALSDHLLERSSQSLNQAYPPDGCPWPPEERLAFDLAADGLLARIRAELGSGFTVVDERIRLAP